MALTLLLILAAFAAGRTEAGIAGTGPQGSRSTQVVRAAPVQPDPAEAERRLARQVRAARRQAALLGRETQLRNRRTGVTCTLRILRIGPSMDPGIAGGTGDLVDSIVNNGVSPCVE